MDFRSGHSRGGDHWTGGCTPSIATIRTFNTVVPALRGALGLARYLRIGPPASSTTKPPLTP